MEKRYEKCFPRDAENKVIDGVGRWIDGKKNRWKWYYHSASRCIFTKHNDTYWRQYVKVANGNHVTNGTLFQLSPQLAQSLPQSSQRCTIIKTHNRIRFKGCAEDMDVDESDDTEEEFHKF